ncbi:hypothetical protein TCELL_0967 [Thermogladius calderae 1633]|uniref:ArnR1-like winged helix-turn-helix domain-containing protein n=1 Tax=Thermogladius calderae (strain DSM 22663 / VKM B-2946 / 1633) TaxID=1184251 RepID=I3TF52_THEC1|nr:winged helix-turn-helix domain-containing protein [Thermogladius calderae]AFK51390.1 hypothetical protein TCELL_0967 [Thermogladius calderae 1633]
MLARAKRCHHDIVYELLTAIRDEQPALKTRVCTASGLPLDRCSKVLALMEGLGLVYREGAGRGSGYYVTEQGYVYIGLYEKIMEVMPAGSYKRRRRKVS